MGAALGGVLVDSGHQVWWASEGRSGDTAARASEAGLTDAGTLARLVDACELLVSIGPPHAATDIARAVTAAGGERFDREYLEANAVAPQTVRAIAGLVHEAGGNLTDGAVIGPPPVRAGTTRLYLSGPEALAISELWTTSSVECHLVDDRIGSASALKLSYAAWTKGTAALLLAIRAAADAEGVSLALLDEWRTSQPELIERCSQAGRSALNAGWRWSGEMEEIAAMLAAAGLPAGFGRAAAEVFARIPRQPWLDADSATDAAVAALRPAP
jgi:3-hydroxyisobutyrate dehydrogenase-like beta-hydroxyacid dehydrogenase